MLNRIEYNSKEIRSLALLVEVSSCSVSTSPIVTLSWGHFQNVYDKFNTTRLIYFVSTTRIHTGTPFAIKPPLEFSPLHTLEVQEQVTSCKNARQSSLKRY